MSAILQCAVKLSRRAYTPADARASPGQLRRKLYHYTRRAQGAHTPAAGQRLLSRASAASQQTVLPAGGISVAGQGGGELG